MPGPNNEYNRVGRNPNVMLPNMIQMGNTNTNDPRNHLGTTFDPNNNMDNAECKIDLAEWGVNPTQVQKNKKSALILDRILSNKIFKEETEIDDELLNRFFELAETFDGFTFKILIQPYKKLYEKLLKLQDSKDRTLLHVACFKGNYEVVKVLLAIYYDIGLSAKTVDINGNDPLELACIRGYSVSHDETTEISEAVDIEEDGRHIIVEQKKQVSKRFACVLALLGHKNSQNEYEFKIDETTLKKKNNTPLHWAIYWVDIRLANIVSDQYIDQVFMYNERNELPFDMYSYCKTRMDEEKCNLILFSLLDEVFRYLKHRVDREDDETYKEFIRRLSTLSEEDSIMNSRTLRDWIENAVDNVKDVEELKIFTQRLKGIFDKVSELTKDMEKSYSEAKLQVLMHINPDYTKYRKTEDVMYYKVLSLLPWYTIFQRKQQVLWLMLNYHCNPFFLNKNGKNTIHMICSKRGYHKFLKLLLLPEYSFKNFYAKEIEFSKKEGLEIPEVETKNTPLHLAAILDDEEVYQILTEYKVDRRPVNIRGWLPLQLSTRSNPFFKLKKKTMGIAEITKCLDIDTGAENKISKKKMVLINSKFQYAIISRADSENIYASTIYIQLERIAKSLKRFGKLEIRAIEGFKNVSFKKWYDKRSKKEAKCCSCFCYGWLCCLFKCCWCKPRVTEMNEEEQIEEFDELLNENTFIYIVRISQELQEYFAEKYDLNVFNAKYNYTSKFNKTYTHHNEPFRDTEKLEMIMRFIVDFFDIDEYVDSGIIVDHFPVHHFRYRTYIQDYWKKYFYMTLFEPLSPVRIRRGIMPLTLIAMYHGILTGFYFGFLVTFTAFMFPLAAYGLGAYIYSLYQEHGDYNAKTLPFSSLITSAWMAIFFEVWRRREKTLAYNFGTLNNTKKEKRRKKFNGKYIISQNNGKVIRDIIFTAKKKRFLTEFPIFLIGISIAFGVAIGFDKINDKIDEWNEEGRFTDYTYLLINFASNFIQGLVISWLNSIYSWISESVVEWENHEYESTRRASKVVKNVYFQFINNNVSLFLLAFYYQNYERLYKNYAGLFISIDAFEIFKTSVWPVIKYNWELRKFRKKYSEYSSAKLLEFLKENGIEEHKTFKEIREQKLLDQAGLLKYMNFEKKRIEQNLIEKTTMMLDMTSDVDDLYLTVLTQFTLICIFHGVFPLSSGYILLANLALIFYTERMYSTVTKRSLSRQEETIGIWNPIFESVGLAAIIGSALIATFTSDSLDKYFDGNKVTALLVILLAEHLILTMRYLLNKVVNKMPKWIRLRIIRDHFLRNKYERKLLIDSTSGYNQPVQSVGLVLTVGPMLPTLTVGPAPRPTVIDRSIGRQDDVYQTLTSYYTGHDDQKMMNKIEAKYELMNLTEKYQPIASRRSNRNAIERESVHEYIDHLEVIREEDEDKQISIKSRGGAIRVGDPDDYSMEPDKDKKLPDITPQEVYDEQLNELATKCTQFLLKANSLENLMNSEIDNWIKLKENNPKEATEQKQKENEIKWRKNRLNIEIFNLEHKICLVTIEKTEIEKKMSQEIMNSEEIAMGRFNKAQNRIDVRSKYSDELKELSMVIFRFEKEKKAFEEELSRMTVKEVFKPMTESGPNEPSTIQRTGTVYATQTYQLVPLEEAEYVDLDETLSSIDSDIAGMDIQNYENSEGEAE